MTRKGGRDERGSLKAPVLSGRPAAPRAARRAPRDGVDDEPVAQLVGGHLAKARMDADRLAVARLRARPSVAPSGRCRRRSGRTARAAAATGRARGRRSAACRPRVRPNGSRSPAGRARLDDPLELAQPVRAASRPCARAPRADPTRPRARSPKSSASGHGPPAATRGREGGEGGARGREAGRGVGNRQGLIGHAPESGTTPRRALDRPRRGGQQWSPTSIRAAARARRPAALPQPGAIRMTDTAATARRRGPGRHARRQPVRRAPQQGRLRRGQGLPAARRHRPRRVLGRQRPPGVGLLPRAVGLHAGRLLGPRDRRPRPRELRHAAARHPDRADGAAHPRRRDRRARPRPRRRRPGHRVRGPGRRRRRGARRRPAAPGRRWSRSSSTAARTASCAGAPSGRTATSATASSTGATTTACSRPAIGRSRSRPRRRRA